MTSFQAEVDQVLVEAIDSLRLISDLHDLEVLKSSYLGKKGKLTDILKKISTVSDSERPKIGQSVNVAKKKLIEEINNKFDAIRKSQVEESLKQESIDVTLPSRGQPLGTHHPITKVRNRLEEFFIRMGFVVLDGPEIETDFYNFSALNIPDHHPARAAHDTFYFEDGTLLRTQTSTVQIHAMQKMEPPMRVVCPGKVFRRDSDSTHSPMFHQLEMLIIDENVNFANLKWIISKFIEYFFEQKFEYRFRPSYFPFTEPSAEVDIKWQVGGKWKWLELGGCGIVHPNVLKTANIDAERYKGLAFGFGIDRLAMSYYGIEDIRSLFESDLQFLQQFG